MTVGNERRPGDASARPCAHVCEAWLILFIALPKPWLIPSRKGEATCVAGHVANSQPNGTSGHWSIWLHPWAMMMMLLLLLMILVGKRRTLHTHE